MSPLRVGVLRRCAPRLVRGGHLGLRAACWAFWCAVLVAHLRAPCFVAERLTQWSRSTTLARALETGALSIAAGLGYLLLRTGRGWLVVGAAWAIVLSLLDRLLPEVSGRGCACFVGAPASRAAKDVVVALVAAAHLAACATGAARGPAAIPLDRTGPRSEKGLSS